MLATSSTVMSKVVTYVISALKGDISQIWKELWVKSARI